MTTEPSSAIDWGEAGAFVAPDYRGACVANVVPALLEHPAIGAGWMPDVVERADQVVLLVVDGLGWRQLQDRRGLAPVLTGATGGPITTVAPSTTAAALTSISTGLPPAEHGLIGYRVWFGAETLNVLQWRSERGDARDRLIPEATQTQPAFGGRNPVVVGLGPYVESGFTRAHLMPSRYRGYDLTSTLVHEIDRAVRDGERFVYAYYDGLDRVGHQRGHHGEFDAELAFIDRLVGDVRTVLGDRVALLVTADHGQVDCGRDTNAIARPVMALCQAMSGEDRFTWLHAQSGTRAELLALARHHHGDDAWVMDRAEVLDRALLGPTMSSEIVERLGDVALMAKRDRALVHPDAPPKSLIARHGSLTAAEMLVPLLAV